MSTPYDQRPMDVSDVVIGGGGILDQGTTRQFEVTATRYLALRASVQKYEKDMKLLKQELMDYVERYGYDDGQGGKVLDLPQEVEGVNHIQRQRRATKKLDEEAAERLLRRLGLWDRCIKPVPTLDADEIMACLYEGALTDEDIEVIMPTKESFACVPKK